MSNVTELANQLPDELLIARVLSVNQDVTAANDAYGVLVVRYEGQVRGLLRALCRNASQADDLAQDTFLRGWQRLSELRDRAKFAAWIKSLAYRMFLHAERRRKVESRYLQTLSDDEPLAVEGDNAELGKLLGLCRPQEAELMVLVYGFGFTIDEIAQVTSATRGYH